METVRRCCCGVDVHRKFIVATIATTDSAGITSYRQGTFTAMPTGLASFALWLDERDCRSVCIESTGKYWIPLFDLLKSLGMEVCLTHPKYVLRAAKGQITDRKDSKWIADLFKCDLVRNNP